MISTISQRTTPSKPFVSKKGHFFGVGAAAGGVKLTRREKRRKKREEREERKEKEEKEEREERERRRRRRKRERKGERKAYQGKGM